MKMAVGSIGPEFEFHRAPPLPTPPFARNQFQGEEKSAFGKKLFSLLQLELKEYTKFVSATSLSQ